MNCWLIDPVWEDGSAIPDASFPVGTKLKRGTGAWYVRGGGAVPAFPNVVLEPQTTTVFYVR